jgi:cation:H+ antiporter
MRLLDLQSFSVWTNLAIFAAAAVIVWLAGARLARYVDEIAERTGLGHAFLGMVLLGVATSLPEVATTLSGALMGNARLVTANLFGGVAMQVAVLAFVDLVAVRGALTFVTPQPVLLFQGMMLLLLLSVTLAGAAVREPISLLGVGMTPVLVAIGYFVTVRVTMSGKYVPRWQPTHVPSNGSGEDGGGARAFSAMSDATLYGMSAVSAAGIFGAGWSLMLTGDALSQQTGLGASFVGVALVAASTSLPEISTTLSAVRQGNHEMAVSNILGTNCLEVALFLPADAVFRGGPMLAVADRSALLAAALGLVVTCILLLGLLERRDRTVWNAGVDSVAVLIVYGAGLAGLYYLR